MPNIDPSVITSILAGGTLLTLLIGYLRALKFRPRNGAVFHLIVSILLVFGAYVLRSGYWSISWLALKSTSTDVDINVLFDLLVVWGGIHGHIAMYYMIPAYDREDWHVFTAWLYPPFGIISIRRFLRGVFTWLS